MLQIDAASVVFNLHSLLQEENNSAKEIAILIEESFYCQSKGYKYGILFDNNIMSYQVKKPGDHNIHYNIKIWKRGKFYILSYIS